MFYKHLHDPSCDLFVHGEEAPQSKEAHLQAALDAERAAKEAYQSTVVDLRKELATLQAQLRQAVGERDEAASDRDDWITSWRVLQRHNERIEAALTPAAGGTRHGDTVRRVS